ETSLSAVTSGSYTFVTPSKTIMEPAPGSGGAPLGAVAAMGLGAVGCRSRSLTGVIDGSPGWAAPAFEGCSSLPQPPDASLDDPPGRFGQQIGVDEAVQVAVEDALRVPHLEVGAVVLDELVGLQHVGADLAA